MIIEDALAKEELKAEFDRAWNKEFGNKSSHGSIYRFTFLAHFFAGQKDLEKHGLLELFRKSQQLAEYQRAEDAIKRGWCYWVKQEFGIGANEAKDSLKIRQFLLLYQLRRTETSDARREILGRSSIPCGASARRSDDEFFRRLGRALEDQPRPKGHADFVHVLLANWLTAFWWLMPVKAVAADMARIEGKAEDSELIRKYHQSLRQIKSRRSPPAPGAFFSAGWNGCFFSASPPLVHCIENNGSLLLTPVGRRLLGNRAV